MLKRVETGVNCKLWISLLLNSEGVVATALGSLWYTFIMPMRLFAIQYANRGECVGFNLSLLPWEGQGLFGYRC